MITGVADETNLGCANSIVNARFSADLSSLWVDRGSCAFVLQALQENTAKENWSKPIRNPDKPSRRSDEGGSGTPLAVTMQPLVWDEDYLTGVERGNLRENPAA